MDAKIGNRKPLADQSWTIGQLLDWTASFLKQKGGEFPRLDAEVLLAHALNCQRIELYTRYEEEATEETHKRFKEFIRQRLEGCPVAYLVGRKEFFSLVFEVGPSVLIPRPDTETLVVQCLGLAKALPEPDILDLGTGSGNIAVAVAHQHRGARIMAVDISPAALAVARRNAETNQVAGRIDFFVGDLFGPLPSGKMFDFILGNPPYIPHEALATLPVGVRDYEPHLALDGGPGGFTVFERLIRQAPDYLKPGSYLLVEIGSPQEELARQRIEEDGRYDLGPTIRDSSGHPRVLRARRKG
jgi:release factor glutamine methyltransferase